MRSFIIHKIGQLILHTIFWFAVLFFYTVFFGHDSLDSNYVWSFSLFLMPITIGTTYVFIYKIIPEYLITKRYIWFGIYTIYAIIISLYLIAISVFFGLIYLSNFEQSNMAPISKSPLFVAVGVYLIVIVVSAFKLLKLNLKQSQSSKILETKILETQLKLKEQELKYLKMQIHPHFLFNTLNTLYGFALMKADQAPEMILKLSSLLDYLLYKIDKPFVHLNEDINNIKDYIELEKMRFNNTLAIKFDSNIGTNNFKIAPMLLIPFVENSFKHGAIISGKLGIDISLFCKNKTLYFTIENTKLKTEHKADGIGLENIKKRLDLLYKDNYVLKIDDNINIFKVDLELNLS